MIIIEGVDNSGKSTLAQLISQTTGLPIVASEGPPKHDGEMEQRLARYSGFGPCIFDRHPIISEKIYGDMRGTQSFDHSRWSKWLAARQPLVIYCDPLDRGLGTHVVKAHDKPEHLDQIETNYNELLRAYRNWAITAAHFMYRIGDPPARILRAASRAPDMFGDIDRFHQRFELHRPPHAQHLPDDIGTFRVRFLVEELSEYVGMPRHQRDMIASLMISAYRNSFVTLEQRFDALIDLTYVALGTAYLHGFPFNAGWSRVHASNMTKVRALRSEDSTRGSIYDVVKPPGFKPADLSDLVAVRDQAEDEALAREHRANESYAAHERRAGRIGDTITSADVGNIEARMLADPPESLSQHMRNLEDGANEAREFNRDQGHS